MVTCDRCGGNCDNGELIGGICLECLEEEQQEQLRTSMKVKMMNSPSYQMELNFGGNE